MKRKKKKIEHKIEAPWYVLREREERTNEKKNKAMKQNMGK
jgi:hypothetical protein